MSLSPRSHADGGAAPEGCGSCWGSGWGVQDPPHVCRVPPWAFPSSPESQHGCTESLLLQVMGIMVSLVPTASLRCMGGGDGTRNRNWGGGQISLCQAGKSQEETTSPSHLVGPALPGGGCRCCWHPQPSIPRQGGSRAPPPPITGFKPPSLHPLGGAPLWLSDAIPPHLQHLADSAGAMPPAVPVSGRAGMEEVGGAPDVPRRGLPGAPHSSCAWALSQPPRRCPDAPAFPASHCSALPSPSLPSRW